MIKLERKNIKFELDGREHELRFPSAIERHNYSIEIAKDQDNAMDITVGFIAKLGVDKNIVESMEMEHLEHLLGEISGKKK